MLLKKSFLVIVSLASVVYAKPNGEELLRSKCLSCHTMSRPNDINKLVAPPMMGVMRHIKTAYSDRERAIEFIKDYVLEPNKEKALCLPQKIKKFGLMPSQKGNVSEEELDSIASWMVDNLSPKGMMRHGKHKMMRGK